MKITREVLKRYGLGLCSEEERKAIEEWIETLDDPSMRLSTRVRPMVNTDRLWSKIAQERPEVKEQMSARKVRNIILLQNAMRYAASACFLLAAFLGGRFSVGSTMASPTVDKAPKEHLYIFGGNEARTQILGDSFQIKFDGAIRLYNSGLATKTIQVGDTSLILPSQKNIFLSRSSENPKIRIHNSTPKYGRDQAATLSGDFSVHRLDL